MYWGLASKNIWRNRTRSGIAIAAVASGCISLIIVGGFIDGALGDLREGYIRAFLGHIQVLKKGFTENGLARPFDFMIEQPDRLLREAASLPGVVQVAPRVEFTGLLALGDMTLPFLAQGIDPGREISPMLSMLAGRNLLKDDNYEVVLGTGLARALKAHVGDTVVMLTTTQSGSMNGLDMVVRGIFRSGSKAFDDRTVRLPIKTAQKLLRTEQVQRLTIFLDDTKRTDSVKDALERALKVPEADLEVKAWHEMEESDFVVKLVNYYDRLFFVFKAIVLFGMIITILVTLSMSILERVGDIGTMMALGMKTRDILSLFVTEGLILGLVGGAIGLGGGYALARLLSYVGLPMGVPPTANMEWTARISIVPRVFAFAWGQAVLSSLVSSLYPAWRASRIEIAQALRHNV